MNDRLNNEGPESRRAARRAVEMGCAVIASGWDRPIASQCTDMSPFGMWLETSYPVKAGDTVVVCFVPPKRDRELNLFARVRRVAGRKDGSFGVGVEYDSLDWFEQKTLADCLRGIPPRFPGETRREIGIQPVA
jgi:hypothetical protein